MTVALTLLPTAADAQVFGTFTWQMQPYCNRVTLMLTNTAGGFALSGADDLCGAAAAGSVTGVALFNTGGTVGVNVTIVVPPRATSVHVTAIVSPSNGDGDGFIDRLRR